MVSLQRKFPQLNFFFDNQSITVVLP